MAEQTTIPQAEGPAAPPDAPAPASPPPRRAPVQPAARQRRLRLEPLEAAAVVRCRESLCLSRKQLGALLGLSAVTIRGWELGRPVPAYPAALILLLQRAHDRAGAALEAPRRLRQGGPIRALYELLHVAYRKEEPRSRAVRPAALRPAPRADAGKPCTCSQTGKPCRGAEGLGAGWYCERARAELRSAPAPLVEVDAPAAARTGYEQGAAESLAWVGRLLEEGADLAELRVQLAERAAEPAAPAAPATGPLSIACPQCNQGPGLGCCNYRGKGCAPHGARVRAARKGMS